VNLVANRVARYLRQAERSAARNRPGSWYEDGTPVGPSESASEVLKGLRARNVPGRLPAGNRRKLLAQRVAFRVKTSALLPE
jgi:hypothetical protein